MFNYLSRDKFKHRCLFLVLARLSGNAYVIGRTIDVQYTHDLMYRNVMRVQSVGIGNM